MATDSERLQILIEGEVNDLEKAMKSVERKLDKLGRAVLDQYDRRLNRTILDRIDTAREKY